MRVRITYWLAGHNRPFEAEFPADDGMPIDDEVDRALSDWVPSNAIVDTVTVEYEHEYPPA